MRLLYNSIWKLRLAEALAIIQGSVVEGIVIADEQTSFRRP